jgi:hypothetical protein
MLFPMELSIRYAKTEDGAATAFDAKINVNNRSQATAYYLSNYR